MEVRGDSAGVAGGPGTSWVRAGEERKRSSEVSDRFIAGTRAGGGNQTVQRHTRFWQRSSWPWCLFKQLFSSGSTRRGSKTLGFSSLCKFVGDFPPTHPFYFMVC